MNNVLTLEQKRQFYRDGYIVVKGAISQTLVDNARSRIKRAKKGEFIGPSHEMTDLLNASSLTPILNDMMGQFDPPTTCQVGVLKPIAAKILIEVPLLCPVCSVRCPPSNNRTGPERLKMDDCG